MEMLVGVVRRLKPKNGKPVNGAVEIIGVWKPAVNGGPRRCAKNPVNGVRRSRPLKGTAVVGKDDGPPRERGSKK